MDFSSRLRRAAGRLAGLARSVAGPQPGTELVPLRAQHSLVVERRADQDSITLLSRDGAVRIRIGITSEGSQITVEAPSLSLRTSGDLAIEAERLSLHARQALTLTTDAGARIEATESVRVNGEMIYLNS
jgi:hypothetical protein